MQWEAPMSWEDPPAATEQEGNWLGPTNFRFDGIWTWAFSPPTLCFTRPRPVCSKAGGTVEELN